MISLQGYERTNGGVGFRNHLLILPLVVCSSRVAEMIGEGFEGVRVLIHQHGCTQMGADLEQTVRTLVGFGRHPNVGAVLVVSLGCETMMNEHIADRIAEAGVVVEELEIQRDGGPRATVDKGRALVEKLLARLADQRRREVDCTHLVFGTECGGSDATSGLAGNPAIGYAADLVVEAGGTVVLSETPEFIGAEHILAARAADQAVCQSILDIVARWEERGHAMGYAVREANPTPGNIEGGISTLEEKSLGCIYKGGHTPVRRVVGYAEPLGRGGLVIMDTPGHDVESMCGMVAGGAQIVAFTTGRGTPTGNPIAPVIKVTGNEHTYRMMEESIDVYVGDVLAGARNLEQAGRDLFEEIVAVANGKLTKSEQWGYREFALQRTAVSF